MRGSVFFSLHILVFGAGLVMGFRLMVLFFGGGGGGGPAMGAR